METTLKINEQKRMLINKAVAFVAHSKHVFLHSKDKDVKKILICENLLYEIKKLYNISSFAEVKRTILRHRHNLINVLPNEKNNSYNTSLCNYNDIISFCNQRAVQTILF